MTTVDAQFGEGVKGRIGAQVVNADEYHTGQPCVTVDFFFRTDTGFEGKVGEKPCHYQISKDRRPGLRSRRVCS